MMLKGLHNKGFTHILKVAIGCFTCCLSLQFMENWCYDRRTLYSFAKHYETGEALPEEIFQRYFQVWTYLNPSPSNDLHPCPALNQSTPFLP